MKALILLVLLIPTSVKACSPPLDGSDFTCPSDDFILVPPGKNKSVREPIYKNTFGWKQQTLMKKLKHYKLKQNIKLVRGMISKALINYKKQEL